jgi:hypothetical protein
MQKFAVQVEEKATFSSALRQARPKFLINNVEDCPFRTWHKTFRENELRQSGACGPGANESQKTPSFFVAGEKTINDFRPNSGISWKYSNGRSTHNDYRMTWIRIPNFKSFQPLSAV